MRDIKTFEKEDNHYKSIKVGNSWKKDYIEDESNGDKNKNLSVKEYLIKIKPYLEDIITNLQKPGTWKFQLKPAINFISYKDNGEEQVMHMGVIIMNL